MMEDTINRKEAIDAFSKAVHVLGVLDAEDIKTIFRMLPPAQPERLTDKEQRIFLAAMGREEKVCKQVDDEYRNCSEPYEDSLVRVCHEIIRKVKCALWG